MKNLWLKNYRVEALSYRAFFEMSAEDDGQKEKALARLREIISHELTERQRQFIKLYYFDRKTIPQIAKEQNVNRSTVSRVLKGARIRIGRFMGYDFKKFGPL